MNFQACYTFSNNIVLVHVHPRALSSCLGAISARSGLTSLLELNKLSLDFKTLADLTIIHSYLACSIQGFGVTLFGWTGIALLPGVFDHLGGRWGEFGAYWVIQTIASLCFIIASVMFTLETQEKWWKPQMNVLGWWIGFIALLGSFGFEYVSYLVVDLRLL